MSKLAENLILHDTGRHRAKLPSFSMKEQWDSIPPLYREYQVKVTLGSWVTLTDDTPKEGVEHAARAAKEGILEEIFGEFRAPLYAIRQVALEEGSGTIVEQVDSLLNQMFKV